jgi:hypothetical protein
MKWFADNSELHGTKGAEIPDVIFFGGLIVDSDAEVRLKAAIEAIKLAYCGQPRVPIKWNLRDLGPVYEARNQSESFKALMNSSKEWRRAVFEAIASLDCTILVSCIECYSSDRKVLKGTREQISRMVFSNALMRFALHAKECRAPQAQVMLDWPDKGDARPFDSEYASAYIEGKTADGNVTYSSGPLQRLNFDDSVAYTNMTQSTLLQVSDLIVGAVRELVECSLGKRDPGIGVECLSVVKDRIRGAPNKVVGRGVVVSSGSSSLLDAIRIGLEKNVYVA